MRASLRRKALASLLGLLMVTASFAAAGAQDQGSGITLDGELAPAEIIETGKSPSSALAQTDPDLLGRDDAEPVSVVIKLDYDSAATYDGHIDGLAATSPAVTGEPLTGRSSAERAYDRYARTREAAAVRQIERRVPAAEVGQSLRVVYGGVAAVVPANTVADIVAIDGVVAVQKDALNQPLTDASADFINAGPVYEALGGSATAGAGVIYGNLDTGVWPEHPSFADLGTLASPPAKADGTPRACDFGDNPLTPATDVFSCNNKLIGGEPFLDTYLSFPDLAAAEPFHTARDSNGHGTHTSSTTAGNPVASAPIFGVERGPIHGIAPGAWLVEYKVCGIQGCFSSDSAAAVEQAILDGVDVINFSISGGTDPFVDPVELAFLDAYAAGVFVSASAGNEGPTAGTANHVSPWVTTVAASTQTRSFESTLTLTGSSGATIELKGASVTAGAGPAPVIHASAIPGYEALCLTPLPAGSAAGQIVVCERGINARAEKGYNVRAGGAVGMILYNPTLQDTNTDNHWLPTVHLAEGSALLAFLGANTGVTGSFTAGVKATGQGDVIASFSSRGPAGLFVKPDVTAPGVQILAGHTPVPDELPGGPAGEYFQAIAGTSMSSPHVAGAAALVRALHPDWTPGQVKSALMTSAVEDLVKQDLVTPADPFDHGAGRVDVAAAGAATLVLDETPDRFFELAGSPLTAVDLNLPSIRASVAGTVTTVRSFTNPGRGTLNYDVSATAPDGSTISVWPTRLKVSSGATRDVEITIATTELSGTHFGRVALTPAAGSAGTPLHLPVVFTAEQGDVAVTSTCDPATVARGANTTCVVTATNTGRATATVDLSTRLSNEIRVAAVDGATTVDAWNVRLSGVELEGNSAGVPSVAPGTGPAGYLPLAGFGIAPLAVGDETIVNYNTPAYAYNGGIYNRLGVDSNGVLHAGGGTGVDVQWEVPAGPNPALPNNILTPFWTDLNGTGAPGLYVGTLTDSVNTWIVVETHLFVWGTTSLRIQQTWIRTGGVEDITFSYPPGHPADPFGEPFLVGAENEFGEGQMDRVLPTTSLRVTGGTPVPGGSVSYTITARGQRVGDGTVTTRSVASTVLGETVVVTPVTVTSN